MITVLKTRYGLLRALAIWLLVFSSGWFVMLTELMGARVLAPYFGNTIYVWGSVIAIFLLALAIGYAFGGRLTQRFLSPLIPAGLAIVAGAYVALTPLYQDKLSVWLLTMSLDVKWAALIAASTLYAVPMALLGALSPYCIQIATETHLEVGNRAGALYAISTIGSFIGCLITAFALIPGMSLPPIAILGGTALIAVAIVVALALNNRFGLAGVLAAAFAITLFVAGMRYTGSSSFREIKAYQFPLKGQTLTNIAPSDVKSAFQKAQALALKEAAGFTSEAPTVLFQAETPYHRLQVVQEGPTRELILGQHGYRSQQTTLDLRRLSWHIAEYTELAFAGLLYRSAPKRVCVIGVGGGTIPRALELAFPGVKIDAVDIDPTVIKVAKDYFFWRPSKNVRVYAQDGRSFINWALMNGQPQYDWIIVDAYSDDYVPFHLTTAEFIATAKRMLASDGVMAINLSFADSLYGYEGRTFESVFGNANAFVGHKSANVILVSQNGRTKPLSLKEAWAAEKNVNLPTGCDIHPNYIVSCLWDGRNWKADGPVLTDMWAPVENLIK